MLTYAASLVAASVRCCRNRRRPTSRRCSRLAATRRAGTPAGDQPGMTGGVWQMRPLSRGYVEASRTDPGDAPAINPRYLIDETDRRAVIGGLRFVRRLFDAPALAKYVVAKPCRGTACRPTTSCWPTRGRPAAPCSTPAAPAGWAGRDGGGGRPAARAWAGAAARGRCLGDAGGDLDQHQRADDHDRREGGGDDPRGRAAGDGRSRSGPTATTYTLPALAGEVAARSDAGEGLAACTTLTRHSSARRPREGPERWTRIPSAGTPATQPQAA